MKTTIANRSAIQGFPRSRLPAFTDKQKAELKGTYDYFAVNMYTSFMARAYPKSNISLIGWSYDAEVDSYQPDDWEKSAVDTVTVSIDN